MGLSGRENQVLEMASQGLIDEAIAQKLGISLATVRGYWARIRSKLGAGSRSELVAHLVTSQGEAAMKNAQEDNRATAERLQAQEDRISAAEREAIDGELMRLNKSQRDRINRIREEADAERKQARQDSRETNDSISESAQA